MPEILKQGRKVATWKTQRPYNLIFTCCLCGCEWRLKKGEAGLVRTTGRVLLSDPPIPVLTMPCPNCGEGRVTTTVDRGMI